VLACCINVALECKRCQDEKEQLERVREILAVQRDGTTTHNTTPRTSSGIRLPVTSVAAVAPVNHDAEANSSRDHPGDSTPESPSSEEHCLGFHVQTVLPDRSNINASIIRQVESNNNDHDDQTSDSRSFWTKLWFSRKPNSCTICCQGFSPGQAICISKDQTRCHHVFHYECIVEWLKEADYCPRCRNHLATTNV
jgi:hypothetical protein